PAVVEDEATVDVKGALQVVGLWPAACTAVVEGRRVTILVEAAFEVVPGGPVRLVPALPQKKSAPSSKGAGKTRSGLVEPDPRVRDVRATAIQYVMTETGEMREIPIELGFDALSAEGDRCTAVFRGELVLGEAEDPARMHVLAGVET